MGIDRVMSLRKTKQNKTKHKNCITENKYSVAKSHGFRSQDKHSETLFRNKKVLTARQSVTRRVVVSPPSILICTSGGTGLTFHSMQPQRRTFFSSSFSSRRRATTPHCTTSLGLPSPPPEGTLDSWEAWFSATMECYIDHVRLCPIINSLSHFSAVKGRESNCQGNPTSLGLVFEKEESTMTSIFNGETKKTWPI